LVADTSVADLLETLLGGSSSTTSRGLFVAPGASANTLPEGIELGVSWNLLLLLGVAGFLTPAFFFLLLRIFNTSYK
jgi:hypothetical protein